MALVKVLNLKKQEVGEVDLPDAVFGYEVKPDLIHQAVVTQMAGRRRGTASTKTKAEVRGGGRKPFKQKGTGNARQGSTRSPLMPGGGESFGPRPRDYTKTLPKAMAAAAMKSALSDKLASDRLVIIDDVKLAKPKTAELFSVLSGTFAFNKALVVDHDNKNAELAARNLEKHKYLKTEGVNVYDVVNHEWLVLSKKAALVIADKLSAKKKATAEASKKSKAKAK
jgi:large subunit ribosomal protein L4